MIASGFQTRTDQGPQVPGFPNALARMSSYTRYVLLVYRGRGLEHYFRTGSIVDIQSIVDVHRV